VFVKLLKHFRQFVVILYTQMMFDCAVVVVSRFPVCVVCDVQAITYSGL